MATIKSYIDLEQSKKLAEILPLESADMRFCFSHKLDGRVTGHYPMIGREPSMGTIPCWSLAALLDFLPNNYIDLDDTVKHPSLMKTKDGRYMVIYSAFQYTSLCDNPIDACYEMILKLNELKCCDYGNKI